MDLYARVVSRKASVLLIFLFFIALQPSAESNSRSELDLLRQKTLEELMSFRISSASKQPDKISEIPASVIVITREDIQKYGYTSLEEIIENVPGYYQMDALEQQGAMFGVRGYMGEYNRHIAILVNGVRQLNDYYGSNSLSTINVPVEAIDKIEVIRGPMAVLYGTGAFFGVINIVTCDATSSKPVHTVSTSVGSDNAYSVVGRAAGKNKDLKFCFNTDYRHTDGIDVPYSKMGGYGNWNSKGHFVYKRKYFGFSGKYKDVYAEASFDETNTSRPFIMQPTPDFNGWTIDAMTRFTLGYEKDLSSKIKITAKLFYNHYEKGIDHDTDILEDLWEVGEVNSTSFTSEFTGFYKPNKDLLITLGIERKVAYHVFIQHDLPLFGIHNCKSGLGDDQIETRSVYTQLKYNLFDNLLLIGGLRAEQMLPYTIQAECFAGLAQTDPDSHYNYRAFYYHRNYDTDEIALVPRAAVIYSLNQYNVIKLLYGKALNQPSFTLNVDRVGLPDIKDLEPETVNTAEINYISMLTPYLTTQVSYFYSQFENLIVRQIATLEDGRAFSIRKNMGKFYASGFELQFSIIPLHKFNMDMSITMQKTEDKTAPGRTVAFSPETLGYLKAAYSPIHMLTIGVTGNYVSEMEAYWNPYPSVYEDPDSPEVGRIGETTNAYFNLSSNIHLQDLLTNGLFIDLRISNILDSDIFYPTVESQPWARNGTLGAGRSYNAKIGYTF